MRNVFYDERVGWCQVLVGPLGAGGGVRAGRGGVGVRGHGRVHSGG
jgi:hypothetical protein